MSFARSSLICAALLLHTTLAQAQTVASTVPPAPRGPFAVAADQNVVWRVDQSTGSVSYCIRDTVSNDPTLLAQRPPICSAWSR